MELSLGLRESRDEDVGVFCGTRSGSTWVLPRRRGLLSEEGDGVRRCLGLEGVLALGEGGRSGSSEEGLFFRDDFPKKFGYHASFILLLTEKDQGGSCRESVRERTEQGKAFALLAVTVGSRFWPLGGISGAGSAVEEDDCTAMAAQMRLFGLLAVENGYQQLPWKVVEGHGFSFAVEVVLRFFRAKPQYSLKAEAVRHSQLLISTVHCIIGCDLVYIPDCCALVPFVLLTRKRRS